MGNHLFRLSRPPVAPTTAVHGALIGLLSARQKTDKSVSNHGRTGVPGPEAFKLDQLQPDIVT